MIEKCAPLLSDDVIKRAEKLGVALLLDGVKKAKIDIPNGGCMDADVMPVDLSLIHIFRSHGVGKHIYELLEAHHITVVDATCPFVKKIHRIEMCIRDRSTAGHLKR